MRRFNLGGDIPYHNRSGEVLHWLIRQDDKRQLHIIGGGLELFPTLYELVRHYSLYPLNGILLGAAVPLVRENNSRLAVVPKDIRVGHNVTRTAPSPSRGRIRWSALSGIHGGAGQ
jgi:hypothetical protein